jgi:hypothetical protein
MLDAMNFIAAVLIALPPLLLMPGNGSFSKRRIGVAAQSIPLTNLSVAFQNPLARSGPQASRCDNDPKILARPLRTDKKTQTARDGLGFVAVQEFRDSFLPTRGARNRGASMRCSEKSTRAAS